MLSTRDCSDSFFAEEVTTKLQRKARPSGQKNYIKTASKIIKIETNNLGDLLKKTYYLRDAQGNVMSIYTLDQLITPPGEPEVLGLKLTERSIYGSSRVGTENPELLIARTDLSLAHDFDYVQTIGDRRYELSNHLGNVLEVITDKKLQASDDGIAVDYYTADVVAQNDYYPFGMLMPNRNESGDEYRYGFNGMEKDTLILLLVNSHLKMDGHIHGHKWT